MPPNRSRGDSEARRSRNKSCQQCRARKVRCDGHTGSICGNCSRLCFSCSFQDAETHRLSRQPERLRVRQACGRCHSLKVRCSGHLPACLRCQEKGHECIYSASLETPEGRSEQTADEPSSVFRHLSSGTASAQEGLLGNQEIQSLAPTPAILDDGSSFTDPDTVTIKESLDIYFKHLYPLPGYAFLHRASLLDRFGCGEADRCLLLAIIALTLSVTSVYEDEKAYGDRCAEIAEGLILGQLSRPSIVKTQALILLVRVKMWKAEFSSAFTLVAILGRFAFALRLNYENPNVCFLAQESRRRLMWAIYMLDDAWSGGLPEFKVCASGVVHIGLPCPEENFELDTPIRTKQLGQQRSSSEDLGLLAYNVVVSHLRDKVLRYTKEFATGNYGEGLIIQHIQDLETELHRFRTSLPLSATYSDRNLRLRVCSAWLPRFVVLQVWWHQCHCDLYRCVLSGLRESIPDSVLQNVSPLFIQTCQERCVSHASAVSGIFASLSRLGIEFPVLDLEMATCAYQCTRLLFHLYEGHADDLQISTEKLYSHWQSCMKVVEATAQTCRGVQRMKSDMDKLLSSVLPHDVQNTSLNATSPTPQPHGDAPCIPGEQTARSRQILSVHSLLAQSNFVDDSDNIAIPDEKSRSTQQQQQWSTEASADAPEHAAASGSVPDQIAYTQAQGLARPTSLTTPNSLPRMGMGMGVGMEMESGLAPARNSGEEEIWLHPANAFEGAWDTPSIGFDFMHLPQMEWDTLPF